MYRLAYNTNGLAHHRVLDALELLAELGYEGVAITPDVGQLDPYRLSRAEVAAVRVRAEELGLELAIETGARFVMDPVRKHFPTLLEEAQVARARRIDFLKRCIDLGVELGAGVVSIWAGRAPGGIVAEAARDAAHAERERAWARLCEGLGEVLAYATEAEIQIAFEPEPGMFIERPAEYGELLERMGAAGESLGLCLDVGHLLVTGDLPVGAEIRAWAPRLVHVHLDDIKDGIHEHRPFGEGELDLVEVLSALMEVGYDGLAAVELSRDSHRGAEAARTAMEALRAAAGNPT